MSVINIVSDKNVFFVEQILYYGLIFYNKAIECFSQYRIKDYFCIRLKFVVRLFQNCLTLIIVQKVTKDN